jgi:formate hydrogenlyase subunit 3/multisubunit Na+/H+ antiporter MnhD subunit
MSSNRTGFYLFVGILSILLLIGGVFLWSQTKTEWNSDVQQDLTIRPYGAIGFGFALFGFVGIVITLFQLYYGDHHSKNGGEIR